ncbi:hypothetical protein [Pseudomonas sp. 1 R 17]|uniref:hypothetical protein n=1 Tax=Pseudomonas sp. 1 R 17 TaxID=1844091 RepID=UPI000812B7F4|nr:hypothetical protein [Pseudomonas sp. 1 R 17]SAM36049.1 hypothetical protein BN1864_LIB5394:06096 [Pseudomonas sp. 1 R 17]
MIVSTQESSKEIKAPKELEPYLNIQTDKEGKIGIKILDSKILGEKYTLEVMRLAKEVSILNHHNNHRSIELREYDSEDYKLQKTAYQKFYQSKIK